MNDQPTPRDPHDGPGAVGARVFEALGRCYAALDRDDTPDPDDLALVRANAAMARDDAARRAAAAGPSPRWGEGPEPDYEAIAENRRTRGRVAGPELDNAAADAYERHLGL